MPLNVTATLPLIRPLKTAVWPCIGDRVRTADAPELMTLPVAAVAAAEPPSPENASDWPARSRAAESIGETMIGEIENALAPETTTFELLGMLAWLENRTVPSLICIVRRPS